MGQPLSVLDRATFFIIAALLALVWIVYGQTAQHEFLNYDDDTYVYAQPQVTRGLTLEGVRWAFTQVHSDNWHPLTSISHMLNCTLFGLWAGGHHLTNVLLHAASSVLCFFVFWRMTGARWQSAFVAAVFAIHPLHVESVAWISERKDVLSGLFFVLTLGAYARYIEQRSLGRYLAVVALFVAGLLAKPMLVTLPLVLLVLDFWPLHRLTSRAAFLRALAEKVPLLVLSLASAVTTIVVQAHARKLTEYLHLTPAEKLGNAAVSLVTYLRQTFWPAQLAVFYPHPGNSLTAVEIAAAFALVIALTLAGAVGARRQPYLLAGWLWFLVMLLPVLGLIQVGLQAHADRYMYLPQIGLVFAITWLVSELARPWLARSLAITAILLLAFTAHAQVSYWRKSETLWRHTLAVTSQNAVADYNLGYVLLQSGRVVEAIPHLEAAVRFGPAEARVHNNLALALYQVGRVEEAFANWRTSLVLEPDRAEAQSNFVRALLLTAWTEATDRDDQMRNGNAALELVSEASRLTAGEDPTALRVLAAALAESTRFDEAITAATRARDLAQSLGNAALARACEADLASYLQRAPLRTHQKPASTS